MRSSCLRFLLFKISIIICSNNFAQDENFIQRPALIVGYTLHDFKTVATLKNSSFSSALQNNKIGNINKMSSGLGISYLDGISSRLDLYVSALGTFVDYPIKNKSAFLKSYLLVEGDVNLRVKPWNSQHTITPYLRAGLGASKYRLYYGIHSPIGLGVQVNLTNDIFLNFSSLYKIGLTSNATSHLFAGLGIGGVIGQKFKQKSQAKTVPIAVKNINRDADQDGIGDSLDICPYLHGLPAFQGCPDSDNDGISDNIDKCPSEKGILKFTGCPVPDTDGDGINDEEDSCITTIGYQRFLGCPVPDADNDGINDESDSCILIPGSIHNNGCPEISDSIERYASEVAKNILFETGSYILTDNSKKLLLQLVSIMQNKHTLKLSISAHTDNVGTKSANLLLSERRAKSVLKFFIEKGLSKDRLTAIGYGDTIPKWNNTSKEGRQKNRRVELKFYN